MNYAPSFCKTIIACCIALLWVHTAIGLSGCSPKEPEVVLQGFRIATAVDTLTLNKYNPGLVRIGDYIVEGMPHHKDIKGVTKRIICIPNTTKK